MEDSAFMSRGSLPNPDQSGNFTELLGLLYPVLLYNTYVVLEQQTLQYKRDEWWSSRSRFSTDQGTKECNRNAVVRKTRVYITRCEAKDELKWSTSLRPSSRIEHQNIDWNDHSPSQWNRWHIRKRTMVFHTERTNRNSDRMTSYNTTLLTVLEVRKLESILR